MRKNNSLDAFSGTAEEGMMEWIALREGYDDGLPKSIGCIVKVRRKCGEELKVYFHRDKMFPLARFWKDHKLSHWQRFDNYEWLYDVTHWMPLPKPPKEE